MAFVDAYEARFDGPPNAPRLANCYDAAMIALMAMQAAGEGATSAEIAAAVPRVTDPEARRSPPAPKGSPKPPRSSPRAVRSCTKAPRALCASTPTATCPRPP